MVGGYTPGTQSLDALIVGFYKGKKLFFAARVRAGFVPATRREVFAKIKTLKIPKCPFANLPEKSEGRWGQGLMPEKMGGVYMAEAEAYRRRSDRFCRMDWRG